LSVFFLICNIVGLFIRDNDPEDQVEQESGHASRDQGDQKSQPEPKRADAKKICQPTTYTRKDAIMP
jgi:hypothetical protein